MNNVRPPTEVLKMVISCLCSNFKGRCHDYLSNCPIYLILQFQIFQVEIAEFRCDLMKVEINSGKLKTKSSLCCWAPPVNAGESSSELIRNEPSLVRYAWFNDVVLHPDWALRCLALDWSLRRPILVVSFPALPLIVDMIDYVIVSADACKLCATIKKEIWQVRFITIDLEFVMQLI